MNTLMQIITDTKEPAVVANPIGNKVPEKYFDAIYAKGIRAQIMEIELCRKENPDNP